MGMNFRSTESEKSAMVDQLPFNSARHNPGPMTERSCVNRETSAGLYLRFTHLDFFPHVGSTRSRDVSVILVPQVGGN